MKTKEEIEQRIIKLESYLKDALEENFGGMDANALQDALNELKWVIS